MGYHTRHTINNSGSAISQERKIKLDIDTASPITAGKLKSDCSDARFTAQNGQLLEFFIDTNTADCNDASTDFYIKLPSVISGEQNIYFYYGNPSASSIKKMIILPLIALDKA